MFDETRRLREDRNLLTLLDHYVRAGAEDREAWLDRHMELAGVEPKELARLHGELIAYGWVEQNTGVVSDGPPGTCPRCYRTTAAGRRALQRADTGPEEELEAA